MKFLICTDGSDGSRAAFGPAARFASALGAELVFVRVLDPRIDAADVVTPKLEDATAEIERRWTAELAAVVAEAGLAGDISVPKREWGKEIADAIHAAADETGAVLLAIATRGTGKVRHALLGSVAMGVIKRADLPVMTVVPGAPAPAAAGADGPYHIVITSDGSPDSRSVFGALAPLLVPGSVKVTLVQAVAANGGPDARQRAAANLEGLADRLPAGVEREILVVSVPSGTAVAAAIAGAAREQGADAIASATHGHSARRHLVAGSTALGLVEASALPVILVKSSAVD